MSRVSYYLDGRLFEWVFAASMVLLALEIFIWPVTLKASAFQWVTLVINSKFIGVALFVAGWSRCMALIANGSSLAIGPWARSIGALFGAVVWFQFGLALVYLTVEQNFPSPGIPFWFMFTLAELRITYRAVLDVRSNN